MVVLLIIFKTRIRKRKKQKQRNSRTKCGTKSGKIIYGSWCDMCISSAVIFYVWNVMLIDEMIKEKSTKREREREKQVFYA